MKRRTVQVNLLLLGLAVLWVYLLADNWGMAEGEGRLDSPGPEAATAASSRPASRASASDAGAIAGHHLFHLRPPQRPPRGGPGRAGGAASARAGPDGDHGTRGGRTSPSWFRGAPEAPAACIVRLKVGEELDGYTLVRIEADRVVMKTGAREIKVGMHDRSRKPRRTARTPNSARTASPSRSARPRTTAVGSGGAARRQPARSRSKANRLPGTRKAPLGTVRDGKRLVERTTPFGRIRIWVDQKSK